MITLPQRILDEIATQAAEEGPNEACGYLAGRDGAAVERYAMTNADASPEHFSFVPHEQFAALKRAREADLELIAVYHSHPETPARMSAEDIRLANDPSTVYLIYSVPERRIRGFTVTREKEVREHDVRVALDDRNTAQLTG